MRLRDRLENINSSLLIVCLKTPINVYTYVPRQQVYPLANGTEWKLEQSVRNNLSRLPGLSHLQFSCTGSF